ncbi:TatD family hydrolase [Mucilaginibacter phyllosphaerae]|uniref:TatD DNase family protein n=1 Tax=Mucilaginibacter phyllosphaerae TaxID=1812349 RepID=A0A4Y8AB97_9SPHI|nr:TatD family hydrolase [Mucilaginibacter phyllosphaerae]MBB3969737.1 TatD DNase family protein [Mucilaginibacter phyllosphaerae]TEW65119.1 TatD family deoxyribonuclease [Mucilaginibacter phyllosphaerae]GGH17863.1 TatD family hydrolase [Mucilaginibacter phyllosphaerae]
MVLTDTHTHLYYETDADKRAGLMQRCIDNGVSRLFLPNVDAASVPMVFDLLQAYPGNCYAMLGLHPCSVNNNWEEELAVIQPALHKHPIYAIGEIGIDLYWDKTFLNEQIQAFKLQIKWAKSLNLPIVIHCRDAFDEVYQVLLDEQDDKLRGIFHCFGGTPEQANKITGLGFYLGIGGVVTYKKAGLDLVLPQIDLKHIVLETDSPYLAPVPYRGKPNESSYLIHVAQKVAELYQIPVEEVANITTQNSIKIFGV